MTATPPKPSPDEEVFNPEQVSIALFGCCSYEDTWKPGIEGWGRNDEESRASGYVSVEAYDKLLALYKKAVAGLADETAPKEK